MRTVGKVPDGARRWLARKYREVPLALRDLRAKLAGGDASLRPSGANPENIIWIFGSSGRSGTTWLRSMMSEMPRHRVWEEPMVGQLFGDFHRRAQTANLRSAGFIMGDPVRKGWIRSIRNFVLDGARYVQPLLAPEDYLVIKEPNGSVGAPLLMEALPESRMIFLIRDPRDVVASTLDGAREGNWLHEWKDESGWKREALPDRNPNAFARKRSSTYMRHASRAKEAYEAHKGRKVLVRYEDLRADTLGEMTRLYAALEIPVDQQELAKAVRKHAWESIPQEEKGEGKFYRKAKPGGWQEDLTEEQARVVERITAPLLKEFYAVAGNQVREPARQQQAKKTPPRRRRDAAAKLERIPPELGTVTGRIVSMDLEARRFTLKSAPGNTVRFKFDPKNLKLTLNREAARLENLGVGQWSKVSYVARDRVNLAHSVELQSGTINPNHIVWIFGATRTGSSWLAGMMGELEQVSVWFEPGVGEVLDPDRADLRHRRGRDFVFAPRYRAAWLHSLRGFVLDGAAARFPEHTEDSWLVVKEPRGSVGAPILVEAMPESRMVLLVRDPRDIAASWLDAAGEGAWQHKRSTERNLPLTSLEERVRECTRNLKGAREAYEAHKGRKVLVRYEDLRADALGTMRRIYSTLEIPVDEGELARAVKKHSWENIPEEKKGEGKFYRKATPGGWQEDLTEEQTRAVEKIAEPVLKEFYPEKAP